MKKLSFLILFIATAVFADAVIFSGNDVKTLKQNIDLFGITKILSINGDPSTGAGVSAPKGSIALSANQGKLFQKFGVPDTNWKKILAGQADLATEVTGILPVANGGTGSATQNFVDLSSGQTIAGTKTFSSTIVGNISGNAGTVTTNANLSGDVTSVGNTTTYSGIVPIAKGGTGSATQNFVDLTTAQSIAGTKTFSSTIQGSISGNAATVTTNANLSGDVTSVGNTTTYNGIVPVNKGGTGSATQNFVDLSTSQTIGGAKTFSSTISASNLSGTNTGDEANFASAVNSSAPNATVPVVSWSVVNGATDVDAVVKPKGLGAFSLQTSDGTTAGGNKRGANAVDLQTASRTAATQVASGNASFVVGNRNTASGQRSSAVGGDSNQVTSTNGVVLGGTTNQVSGNNAVVLGGSTNIIATNNSVAGGNNVTTPAFNQFTFGQFNLPLGTETTGSWVSTDPLLVLGNGTGSGASRSNAAIVYKNGSASFQGSVTSGSTATNYLTDPLGENLVTSWSAYADAAGTAPVDGTGGSPTVTATNSTSSPIEGNSSLVLTKTAVNSQGQGVSIPFTINSNDTKRVLRIDLDYQIASGTYADDDVQFWIYDITNSALIQPAPFKLKNITGIDTISMEFQATASTSYRLIAHIASTSASAFTIKFDRMFLGRGSKVFGSPITDWVAYTPTYQGGTLSSAEFYWRRVGSDLEVRGRYTITSPTASELRIGLPFTTSSTVLSANPVVVGYMVQGDVGASPIVGSQFQMIAVAGVNYLTAGTRSGSFSGLVNRTGSDIQVAATPYTFSAMVPIQGWGSTVQMGDQADTRVIAASASGNVGAISASFPIKFPTVSYDTHGAYSASTGQFTAPTPGYYQVNVYVGLTSLSSVPLYAYINGAQKEQIGGTTSTNGTGGGSAVVYALAGQTIDIRSTSAVNYNVSQFTISKVLGPSQVAATETVSASYWLSANFAASSTTPINFDSKEWDTHNAVTTSATAWRFTAPVSGTYVVGGLFFIPATTTDYKIYKNGSAYKILGNHQSTHVSTPSTRVKLLAGEYIDIRPSVSGTLQGGTLSSSATSNITISREGNY